MKGTRRAAGVPTRQNAMFEKKPYLRSTGNPVTPKYLGDKYEGEARLQEYDHRTGKAINKRKEAIQTGTIEAMHPDTENIALTAMTDDGEMSDATDITTIYEAPKVMMY